MLTYERYESTARILGGRYGRHSIGLLCGTYGHLAFSRNYYVDGLDGCQNPETGVLADLVLAFVFDYTADKCFELRCYIEKTQGLLHYILLISYPFLAMIEIITTFIVIILRAILNRVVALTLLPFLLLAHIVCAWQKRSIHNKIDKAIQACAVEDQSDLNTLKKILLEGEKTENDQYTVKIKLFKQPDADTKYFLIKYNGDSLVKADEFSKHCHIPENSNPDKDKVFVHQANTFYELNYNLAEIKLVTKHPYSYLLGPQNYSITPIAANTYLHKVLEQKVCKHLVTQELNTQEMASLLNTDNKVKVDLFNNSHKEPICHSFSFSTSPNTRKALESMAELTLYTDYVNEVKALNWPENHTSVIPHLNS